MPNRVISAALRTVGVKVQSFSQSRPARSPIAAMASAGCGPESPMGMGSGGSSRDAAKKMAIQRAGRERLHQSAGIAAAGAARMALRLRVGATAIAAAHVPNKSARADRAPALPVHCSAGMVLLVAHFQCEVQDREDQAE